VFVCTQCSDVWIDDPVAAKLESLVAEVCRKQALVEVTQWQQVARALSRQGPKSACFHTIWRRVRTREVPCWYLMYEATSGERKPTRWSPSKNGPLVLCSGRSNGDAAACGPCRCVARRQAAA
jgi:hypothetical protein